MKKPCKNVTKRKKDHSRDSLRVIPGPCQDREESRFSSKRFFLVRTSRRDRDPVVESALTDERRHFLHLEETQPGYRLPGRQASDNRVTFLEYEKYALITKHVLPFPSPPSHFSPPSYYSRYLVPGARSSAVYSITTAASSRHTAPSLNVDFTSQPRQQNTSRK